MMDLDGLRAGALPSAIDNSKTNQESIIIVCVLIHISILKTNKHRRK